MSETIKIEYEGHSPDNKFFFENVLTDYKAASYVVDKYAKNNALLVTEAKWNFDDKSIDYQVLVNKADTKSIHATYEDICKSMKWKSFEFDEKKIRVLPVKKTEEEIAAELAPLEKKWNELHGGKKPEGEVVEPEKTSKLSEDDAVLLDLLNNIDTGDVDEDFGEVSK